MSPARWPDPARARVLLLPWVIALAVGLDYFDNAVFSFYAVDIAGGVQASPDELIWASSAYAVAAVLGIVQHQWWIERLGHSRYIGGCLLLFGLAGVAAASSANATELVGARAAQGYLMGPMLGATRVLIQMHFPADARAGATRRFLYLILAGSALAPLLGGQLMAAVGWRGLFACTVPAAVACGLLALATLPATGRLPVAERSEPHLWPYLILAAGLACLQLVGQQLRFLLFTDTPLLAVGVLAGLALCGWFAWQQARQPRPLLRFEGLREATFRTGLVLFAAYYFISNALGYLVSRLLEGALGYPVDVAGNLVGLTGLVSLGGAWLYFRYASAMPRKKGFIATGFLLAALVAWWLGRLAPTIGRGWLVPPLILRGLLLLFIALPTANITFRVFTLEQYFHSYRLKNIVKQLVYSASTAAVLVLEQHRFALHYARLVEHASPADPAFQQWTASMATAFAGAGFDAPAASRLALAQFSTLAESQATWLSTFDGFLVLAGLALGAAVFTVVQKRIA